MIHSVVCPGKPGGGLVDSPGVLLHPKPPSTRGGRDDSQRNEPRGWWVGPGNSFLALGNSAQGGRHKARNVLPRVSAPWTRREGFSDLAAGSALELSLIQVPTSYAQDRITGLYPQDVRQRHPGMEVGSLVPDLRFSVCTRWALHPKHWKGLGALLPLPQLHPGANQKPGLWQSLSPAPACGFAFSRFPLTGRADWPTDRPG